MSRAQRKKDDGVATCLVHGGPLHGTTREYGVDRWLCIYDRTEAERHTDDDGVVYTIYGKHYYELRGAVLPTTGELVMRWVWTSYHPPSSPVMQDWDAVKARLEACR